MGFRGEEKKVAGLIREVSLGLGVGALFSGWYRGSGVLEWENDRFQAMLQDTSVALICREETQ